MSVLTNTNNTFQASFKMWRGTKILLDNQSYIFVYGPKFIECILTNVLLKILFQEI